MDKVSTAAGTRRRLWMQPGVRGLLVWLYGIPLAGNLNVIASVYGTLESVPSGTLIRPMGLALWIGVVGIGTAICGVSLGGLTVVLWRRVPLLLLSGFVSALLSLTPF